MRVLFPILPLFLCAAAALQAADVRDGFLPEGARVVELARLPEAPKGAEPACTVRLTPPGVPMALYRGRLLGAGRSEQRARHDRREQENGRTMTWHDNPGCWTIERA